MALKCKSDKNVNTHGLVEGQITLNPIMFGFTIGTNVRPREVNFISLWSA